ncbi:MAG: hypothetical protein ACRDYB_14065, partial [Acidimicrobiales bacterium]
MRRAIAALLVVLVALVIALVTQSLGGPTGSGGPRTTTSTLLNQGDGPPYSPEGTFGVATTKLDFVEPAGTDGAPARPLPTSIWFPTRGSGATPAADRVEGPYPLIVF